MGVSEICAFLPSASAVLHKSSAIMLAAVKFFLGQDEREENEEEEEGDGPKVEKPTAKDFYNATKKGTASTKKKKEKRLKRAMAAVKKQETKSGNTPHESFSAIQLLHDPQVPERFGYRAAAFICMALAAHRHATPSSALPHCPLPCSSSSSRSSGSRAVLAPSSPLHHSGLVSLLLTIMRGSRALQRSSSPV